MCLGYVENQKKGGHKLTQGMKTEVLSMGSKKNNCKIRISSENGKPHPFHPAQFLLQRCFNKSMQGAVPGFSPKPPCQKPGGLRCKPKEDETMNN